MVTWEQIAKANAAITTMDVKGKDYAEVNQRVKAFRMVYPTGLIETELTSNTDGVCIFRATVGYYEDDGRFVKLATGTAFEVQSASYINKTSYIENGETSAVGRALGIAGFGIDTSICSAEELQNALAQQEATQPVTKPVAEKPKPKPKPKTVKAPADTDEDAEYRALCLRKIRADALDKACMNHWGTGFAYTPVAKIKTMLPEEYLIKMEDKAE